MEKTIQRLLFEEIKEREGISFTELAKRCDVGTAAIYNRLNHSVSFETVFEMLRVCGYELTASKVPPFREATINVGKVDCDGCIYKNGFFEIENNIAMIRGKLDEEKTVSVLPDEE